MAFWSQLWSWILTAVWGCRGLLTRWITWHIALLSLNSDRQNFFCWWCQGVLHTLCWIIENKSNRSWIIKVIVLYKQCVAFLKIVSANMKALIILLQSFNNISFNNNIILIIGQVWRHQNWLVALKVFFVCLKLNCNLSNYELNIT